ncbi:Major facilitator superfamily domain general substrate transporter [Penicillium malachiteum]|uniref:Major facilitator superfamily domain general substrate transporter n=1 Tax=Penicillium malachiteum TaxID=1324776 RepID=UPI002549A9AC|nr:Major facilitator superfamily domain general substrate transporter [Penicillium malachiteum]KAJ5729810.1 Major facilitator superfamily domain general substrate transporter [Penicillium malachiteum]
MTPNPIRLAGSSQFPQGELARAVTNQSAMEIPKSLLQESIFIGVVCAAQFMTQVGLALAIVPLHIIGDSFNVTNSGKLSWYAAAYSLTVGTFILIAGRLGDLYGHRLMFIGGFPWFGLWSLLGGFSVWSNQVFFDICRAFQGIGPAFLLPNAMAILGRTYPPGPRKDMVFSIFGATAPGGFAIGGGFSALISQRVWWPWAYWIMGIVCIAFAIFGIFAIPNSPSPKLSKDTPWWVKCDLAGGMLGITALILINFAWNQGPSVGWSRVYVYILLILSFLCLALFLWIEQHVACPLLPRGIFSEEVAWVLACMAAGWSSFGIVVFYFFQFMEVIKGDTPLLVLAKWTPSAISGAVAAVTTGFILARLRPSLIMLIAMLAFTGGQILLATLPVHQTYWAQAFVICTLTPWECKDTTHTASDMSFPSGTIILSNSMPREHQGLAASLINTIVNYSISIGLGLAGTVESRVNRDGTDILRGYRGAAYMGVGLAGLGVGIATVSVIRSVTKRPKADSASEA